ncbi:MAG: zinc-ribbon domain-containing protein [Aliishimia sp.]
MRIICPNCDAQYEVPATVVPADGRDVECSNCGKTWFQHHPDHMPKSGIDQSEEECVLVEHPAPSIADEKPETPPATGLKRREIAPEVADILREEAQRETIAREAETLEVQTDLNLTQGEDRAKKRALESKNLAAQMRDDNELSTEQSSNDDAAQTAAIAATVSAAVNSRRELLPDIEEINSTLRSTGDRDIAGEDTSHAAPIKKRKKRSFRRGFVMSVALFSIAVLTYVFAPKIAETVPQADPWLSSYVTWVDSSRVWLDGKFQDAAQWLDATAAASSL